MLRWCTDFLGQCERSLRGSSFRIAIQALSRFGCKAPSSYCYPLLREGYPVVAIENCRYVHFSVIALYFGNVGKQLLKRFFRFKVPFDQIFSVLNLCCSLCCAVRSPSSVYHPHFGHRTVYRSGAYVNSFLFKSHVHALDTVIVVVGMFIQNCLNFDRKKLSCRRLVSVFQPSVIARFAILFSIRLTSL